MEEKARSGTGNCTLKSSKVNVLCSADKTVAGSSKRAARGTAKTTKRRKTPQDSEIVKCNKRMSCIMREVSDIEQEILECERESEQLKKELRTCLEEYYTLKSKSDKLTLSSKHLADGER